MFDKHDTEDCPCQAMDYDDDTPSPSHHHGDRKQLRPYCDICEGRLLLQILVVSFPLLILTLN